MQSMRQTADSIIAFWFEEITPEQWWAQSDEFNRHIESRFGAVHDAVERCALTCTASRRRSTRLRFPCSVRREWKETSVSSFGTRKSSTVSAAIRAAMQSSVAPIHRKRSIFWKHRVRRFEELLTVRKRNDRRQSTLIRAAYASETATRSWYRAGNKGTTWPGERRANRNTGLAAVG